MGVRCPPSPERAVTVAFDGTTVLSLTCGQRLRAWDTATGAARTLGGEHVAALAADGSMALSFRATGKKDVVLETWEPRSGRVVARKVFPYGVEAVLGVSRGLAILDVGLPHLDEGTGAGEPSMPEPTSLAEAWDLGSGQLEEIPVRSCADASLSLDGARYACGLLWVDRARPGQRWPPQLAPDWAPAHPRGGAGRAGEESQDVAAVEPGCRKCGPAMTEPVIDRLSARMSRDGSSMLVAYTGAQGHDEWRLERWVPDAGGNTRGRLKRLAAVP